MDDEDQLEEDEFQPSQKEARLGEEEIEDEGGGERSSNVTKLILGREEAPGKEEKGEKDDLKEGKFKREEVGRKEEIPFSRDKG